MKAIDQAYARWMKERPLEYELTVVQRYNNPGPYVSLVRGGEILRSRGGYTQEGHDIAPTLRTVEGLFEEARNATLFPVHEVEMTFDERFGYPSLLRIDTSRGGFDDERTLIASVKVIVR